MMQRCYSEKCDHYSRYGGRGIKVCDEWKNQENFIQWARETIGCKKVGITLDRINVNGNYEPSNCRWATQKEQCNNKRNNRKITINGITKNITTWCEEYGISLSVVRYRINQGMSHEEAITTPVRQGRFLRSANGNQVSAIEIDGEARPLLEWCKFYGMKYRVAYCRIALGWNVKKALTTPIRKRKKKCSNLSAN